MALFLLLPLWAHAVEIDGIGPIKPAATVIPSVSENIGQPALNIPQMTQGIPGLTQPAGLVPELPQAAVEPANPELPAALAQPQTLLQTPEANLIPGTDLPMPKPLADSGVLSDEGAPNKWLSAPWENLMDLENAVFDGAARRSGDVSPKPRRPSKPKPGDDEEEPKSPTADDGGGPNYPSRIIRFVGEKFRSVLFRPNVPVESEIVRAINTARKSIHISLYEFKQTAVLAALRQARDRGVQVHIILDYKNVFPEEASVDPDNPKAPKYKASRSKEIWALAREGFNVKVLKGLGDYGINHNKIAIFDAGETYSMGIFGSYNWNWTAEEDHYENANFTADTKRIGVMKNYWDWLNSLAEPISYNHKNGMIAMANPDRVWPATVPAPPIKNIPTIDFHGTKLPIMVLSPNRTQGESIEDRLVQAIQATSQLKDQSKRTIDISIFALRSTKIAEALVAAHKVGTKVRVIMDQRQATDKDTEKVFGIYAQYLAFNGIEVRTLAGPDPVNGYQMAQKDHHKFSIFAGELVETGSANYTTYAAIGNFENGNFIDEEEDVKGYAFVYEHMWSKATKLDPPAAAPSLPTHDQLVTEIDRPQSETPEAAPGAPSDSDAMTTKPRDIPFNGGILPSFAFRPETPVEPLIIKAIGLAKKSIRLSLYEFTLDGVLDALRDAKKRGLKIEIVIDRSHVYTTGKDHTGQPRKPSPEIMALIEEKFDIKVLRGNKSGIQHNKYAVFDAEDIESGGGLTLFGSYNWASTAEHNHFENIMFSNEAARIKGKLAYHTFQRGLAEAVDADKLEEVLSTGHDAEAEAWDREEAAVEDADIEAAGLRGPRRPPIPTPPEDKDTPFDLNGEKFQREYYSPNGGILDAWLRAIKAAKTSIDIGMFSFYSRDAAEAIVAAVEQAKKEGRDLRVRLVLDAGQSALAKLDGVPIAQWFLEKGIDVKQLAGPNPDRDPMFEKQHSKFILVDGKFLMTGSFNLSDTAENNNFENENVIMDPTDVAGFVEWFERLYQKGWTPRERKGTKKPAPAKTGDGAAADDDA